MRSKIGSFKRYVQQVICSLIVLFKQLIIIIVIIIAIIIAEIIINFIPIYVLFL